MLQQPQENKQIRAALLGTLPDIPQDHPANGQCPWITQLINDLRQLMFHYPHTQSIDELVGNQGQSWLFGPQALEWLQNYDFRLVRTAMTPPHTVTTAADDQDTQCPFRDAYGTQCMYTGDPRKVANHYRTHGQTTYRDYIRTNMCPLCLNKSKPMVGARDHIKKVLQSGQCPQQKYNAHKWRFQIKHRYPEDRTCPQCETEVPQREFIQHMRTHLIEEIWGVAATDPEYALVHGVPSIAIPPDLQLQLELEQE